MASSKKNEITLEQIMNKLCELQTEVRSNQQETRIIIEKHLLGLTNPVEKKDTSSSSKMVDNTANKRVTINKWFANNYISGDKNVMDLLSSMKVNIEEIKTKIEEDNNKKKKKDKKEVLDKRIADTIWKSLNKKDKDAFKPLHHDYKTKISEDETKDLEKENVSDDDE